MYANDKKDVVPSFAMNHMIQYMLIYSMGVKSQIKK